MSELAVATKVVFGLASYLKTMLDPGLRRRLEDETTTHVLSELPRLVQLIEERCGDVEARGVTVQEAVILAHQVIEKQKQTLDEEKRQRLSNVLVNGFCVERWNKVTHRLMVRLAAELEEEHIERIRRELFGRTPAQQEAANRERAAARARWDGLVPRPTEAEEKRERDEDLRRKAVERAIERELIAVGLCEEIRAPKPMAKPIAAAEGRGRSMALKMFGKEPAVFAEHDMQVKVRVTPLGRMLLEYLRDPSEPKEPDAAV